MNESQYILALLAMFGAILVMILLVGFCGPDPMVPGGYVCDLEINFV